MAQLNSRTELTTPADDDLIHIIDVSDTSDGVNGTSKKIQKSNLFSGLTASDITDFDTEVANNSAVTLNTAKVTNATHTGEVTGSTTLTIADNVIDEANLKLDTAPTNDYVLTADSTASGGMKWAEASGGRETLTANRTYYVDGSSGSDSNNGLTTGTAFATVQKAVDVTASLDISIYDVTIDLYSAHSSTQTFIENVVLKDPVGAGQVTIQGNSSNQDSITIQNSSGSVISCIKSTKYYIKNLKVDETAGSTAIYVDKSGILITEGLHIAGVSNTYGFYSGSNSYAQIVDGTNDYKFSGVFTHILLSTGIGTVRVEQTTINTDSITSFLNFAFGIRLGLIDLHPSITFTTTAITGRKYSMVTNSVGHFVSTLPGNTAGTTATGGQAT